MSSALLWFVAGVAGALVSAVVCVFGVRARAWVLVLAAVVALVAFCGAAFIFGRLLL